MIHHFSGAAASQWWDWVRVESLVSDVLPTAGQLCIYDRDTVDDAQIDDMCATHELVHQDGRVRRNPAAIDPEQLRRELLRSPAPRPGGPPAVVLRDPDLNEARATAARLAEDAQLSADDAASLVFAVSETVANARQHGSPAVGLRAWTSPGRAHVVVEDGGPGPADTAVGLSAAPDRPSGLWLSHQLLAVRHEVNEGGFLVHLTAGR